MSPYYSLDITNNILERAFAERLTITPFKLHTLDSTHRHLKAYATYRKV